MSGKGKVQVLGDIVNNLGEGTSDLDDPMNALKMINDLIDVADLKGNTPGEKKANYIQGVRALTGTNKTSVHTLDDNRTFGRIQLNKDARIKEYVEIIQRYIMHDIPDANTIKDNTELIEINNILADYTQKVKELQYVVSKARRRLKIDCSSLDQMIVLIPQNRVGDVKKFIEERLQELRNIDSTLITKTAEKQRLEEGVIANKSLLTRKHEELSKIESEIDKVSADGRGDIVTVLNFFNDIENNTEPNNHDMRDAVGCNDNEYKVVFNAYSNRNDIFHRSVRHLLNGDLYDISSFTSKLCKAPEGSCMCKVENFIKKTLNSHYSKHKNYIKNGKLVDSGADVSGLHRNKQTINAGIQQIEHEINKDKRIISELEKEIYSLEYQQGNKDTMIKQYSSYLKGGGVPDVTSRITSSTNALVNKLKTIEANTNSVEALKSILFAHHKLSEEIKELNSIKSEMDNFNIGGNTETFMDKDKIDNKLGKMKNNPILAKALSDFIEKMEMIATNMGDNVISAKYTAKPFNRLVNILANQ